MNTITNPGAFPYRLDGGEHADHGGQCIIGPDGNTWAAEIITPEGGEAFAQTIVDALNRAADVDLGDTLTALAARRDEYDLAAVAAAQKRFANEEGSVEVDDNALTSRGDDDDGCYVLAWVWVDRESMNAEDEDEDEDEDEEATP